MTSAQEHRELVNGICQDLADAMLEAVELLGPMSRVVTAVDENGDARGRVKITVERA